MTEELLLKQTNALTEKDGWNPLLWAACNGNEDIVRLLIKNNAHSKYLQQQHDVENQNKSTVNDEDRGDPFVKPKDAQKEGKYTPLHWASYKGHYKVVWILLKAGMSPLEIDMHGNTSVH
jgi:ankyrin repeat protein